MSKDYNILVTGASRGIGFAIAKKLSGRCANLLITSKEDATLKLGIKEIGRYYRGNLFGTHFDQSNALESSKMLYAWVKSKVNYLDAIVLSAGIFIEGSTYEMDNVSFSRNMDTNFTFNYYAVNALLELLKKSHKPARIIIIGSTAAYDSYSVPTYGIAKWALRGYTVNLREELRKEKIGVTFISPGPTLTDMWNDVNISSKRILEPNDIALVIDNLFELSDQAVVEELIIRPILGDIDE